jgi:splicing factor 3B subunit 1
MYLFVGVPIDIEAQIKAQQAQREEILREQQESKRAALVGKISYDQDLYGSGDRFEGYDRSITVGGGGRNNEIDAEMTDSYDSTKRSLSSYTAPRQYLDEIERDAEDSNFDPMADSGPARIIDRENDYHRRRYQRALSPERRNAFANGSSESDVNGGEARSYAEVMRQTQLEREEHEIRRKIAAKEKERMETISNGSAQDREAVVAAAPKKSEWDEDDDEIAASRRSQETRSRWDETPRADGAEARKRSRWDETPRVGLGVEATPRSSRWDATPQMMVDATPKRSRWDETPMISAGGIGGFAATPSAVGGVMATPISGSTAGVTPELAQQLRWERELDERNRPLSDEELNTLLPSTGYKILEPPSSYVPIRTPARKLTATPTPMGDAGGFLMLEEGMTPRPDIPMSEIPGVGELPVFKAEDKQYFGKLLDNREDADLSIEELKERKIMRLLLKIKNGTPAMRKTSLRQITDKAREFGAGPLFNQILPLLMSTSLEDQERHLLVKVIDRIMYKLDDLVRPFVHKILVVIEPMLIDEDYYARVEGREIISNLSKAAGLATMIATMRPDIDNVDEYVRNTTARAFSVVASALGIPALLPFLRAVCKSKKSWQARHTGIKIIQQIAILMGCSVLPHLTNLVECIGHGLTDEQQKVRTITALALAALAEAASPYGIESFGSVLEPLWKGIHVHRSKGLAAFLKAVGFITPLMNAEDANTYTQNLMKILVREFQSPDEEMKKIVLKVVKQCAATDGVRADYLREEILPEYFKNFWVRRMALDRRNYRQLVETTVELAQKVGVADIVTRIVDALKDESEPFRKMAMETIEKVISELGATDIDQRLEEVLIDGILYAFQEQTVEDVVMLNGFGVVVNALGLRVKPYLPQICSTILWRLNNKSAKVRQQAADLISRIAIVMKTCGEDKLMSHLGVVLYEYLGEEYPEVLASIIAGLKGIVNVIGMTNMTPPIKDLLPRLTPILKNRHERVQENVVVSK